MKGVSRITSVPIQLDPYHEQTTCLLIFPLRCQSCWHTSFKAISALDLSHSGGMISARVALKSRLLCLGKSNPQRMFPTSTPTQKTSSKCKLLKHFGKPNRMTLRVVSPPVALPPKPKAQEQSTMEPVLQPTNTSTSSPKGCLAQLLVPNSGSDCIVTDRFAQDRNQVALYQVLLLSPASWILFL